MTNQSQNNLPSPDALQQQSQRQDEQDELFAAIDRMREAFKAVPPEEIVREAKRSVAEARERRRPRTPKVALRSAGALPSWVPLIPFWDRVGCGHSSTVVSRTAPGSELRVVQLNAKVWWGGRYLGPRGTTRPRHAPSRLLPAGRLAVL